MKRLKLEDFKLKNLKKEESTTTNQLLGHVLGDCHDNYSAPPVGWDDSEDGNWNEDLADEVE